MWQGSHRRCRRRRQDLPAGPSRIPGTPSMRAARAFLPPRWWDRPPRCRGRSRGFARCCARAPSDPDTRCPAHRLAPSLARRSRARSGRNACAQQIRPPPRGCLRPPRQVLGTGAQHSRRGRAQAPWKTTSSRARPPRGFARRTVPRACPRALACLRRRRRNPPASRAP